jgi:hypothetical protein
MSLPSEFLAGEAGGGHSAGQSAFVSGGLVILAEAFGRTRRRETTDFSIGGISSLHYVDWRLPIPATDRNPLIRQLRLIQWLW